MFADIEPLQIRGNVDHCSLLTHSLVKQLYMMRFAG